MVGQRLLYAGLCALFGATVVAAESSPEDYFGALAFNPETGASGKAVDFPTAMQAQDAARSECGSDCALVAAFSNGCAAYARDSASSWGWWAGADRRAAERRALSQCRKRSPTADCSIRVQGCTTREPASPPSIYGRWVGPPGADGLSPHLEISPTRARLILPFRGGSLDIMSNIRYVAGDEWSCDELLHGSSARTSSQCKLRLVDPRTLRVYGSSGEYGEYTRWGTVELSGPTVKLVYLGDLTDSTGEQESTHTWLAVAQEDLETTARALRDARYGTLVLPAWLTDSALPRGPIARFLLVGPFAGRQEALDRRLDILRSLDSASVTPLGSGLTVLSPDALFPPSAPAVAGDR